VSDNPAAPSPDDSEHTLAYPQPRPIPYGSSPYAVTVSPATMLEADVRQRPLVELADVWTALLGTVGVILLGVPGAFIWVWLAPRTVGIAGGKGRSGLVDGTTKAFVGADVTFLFVGIGAGLLSACVAAVVARHRGTAVSVAMAAGGLAASVLAAWLGRTLSGGPVAHWQDHYASGNHRYFIELGARPFLVAWPLAALLVTFVVGLLTPDRPVEVEPTEAAPSPPEAPTD
jgi:hypothetical protein